MDVRKVNLAKDWLRFPVMVVMAGRKTVALMTLVVMDMEQGCVSNTQELVNMIVLIATVMQIRNLLL